MRPVVLNDDVSDEELFETFTNVGLINDIKEIRDGHAERLAAPGRFVVYRNPQEQKIIVLLALPGQQLN